MKTKSSDKIVYVAAVPPQKKKKDVDKKSVFTSKKKSGDDIPSVKVILPWYVKLLFVLIWTFIVITVFMMLNSLNLFRIYRDWWKKNGGKKYKKVFSMNLLAQYNNFSLGYWLWSLFMAVPVKIPSNGCAQFITGIIAAHALLNDQDDKDVYFMMPYHLCENIAVGTLDHSDLGTGIGKEPEKDKKWDWEESPSTASENGWPVSILSWKKLLHIWGVPLDNSGTPDNDKWTKKDNQNFLYHQYNLPLQTPFILAFMWNLAEDPDQSGTKWYEQAFLSAVGLNETTIQDTGYYGGWWGMLKYGFGSEKDLSYAEITRILYSTQNYKLPSTKCGKAERGIGYGSAIASGLGAAAGILAFAGPEGIPLALGLGALGSGLAASAGGILQTAGKCDIK